MSNKQAIDIFEKYIMYSESSIGCNLIEHFKNALKEIKALQPEQSLEELLDEMPVGTSIIKRGKGYEPLYYPLHEGAIFYALQKTPREALLALKEKLTS